MPTALISALALVAASADPSGSTVAERSRVEFSFATNPLSDFLFYVLDRSTGPYKDLPTAVPLTNVPRYAPFSFLPNTAELSHISRYDQLYGKARTDENHEELERVLKAAEPHYPAFEAYWRTHIAPDEDRVARRWAREARAWRPVAKLEAFERLRFPFQTLKVDVFATESSGSSMQGPPTIFTSTQVPDLAWVVGHEGTHMMLGPKGANLPARRDGPEAIARMTAAGGSEYDLEEAMCLLMQVKLSISEGHTAKTFRVSTTIKPSARRTLLLALEDDWDDYLGRKDLDAADWVIAETLRVLPPSSTGGQSGTKTR
jgi:hypothetical protein